MMGLTAVISTSTKFNAGIQIFHRIPIFNLLEKSFLFFLFVLAVFGKQAWQKFDTLLEKL